MKFANKVGAWLCGVGLSLAGVSLCVAGQRPSKDVLPQRQAQQRPSGSQRQANRPPRNDRPTYSPRRNQEPQQRNETRQREGSRNYQRQGGVQSSRPDRNENQAANRTEAQPHGSNQNRPPERRFQDLSPQEKNRFADTERKLNQLPPQRQQEIRRAGETWSKLTPDQRNHIQNDVLPKWKQMSPDRQKAIQHRLGVLQNMPETARNRHLNDPNFTRGMSEEDKEMLRDLSHQHVGAPDHPQEQ